MKTPSLSDGNTQYWKPGKPVTIRIFRVFLSHSYGWWCKKIGDIFLRPFLIKPYDISIWHFYMTFFFLSYGELWKKSYKFIPYKGQYDISQKFFMTKMSYWVLWHSDFHEILKKCHTRFSMSYWMSYSIFTLMNIKDCESLELVEKLIIESWINDNADALYQQPRIKKRRRFRQGKVNFWDTEWGQLIRSPNVRDPCSREGKLFKRFRVDFDMVELYLCVCLERNGHFFC